jgi:hypothetical protein
LKPVHFLPAVFTLGMSTFLVGGIFCRWSLLPLALYATLVCADSARQNRSLVIGLLSVFSSYIQLTGYGCGFLSGVWRRIVLKKGEFSAFNKTFYK